MKRIVLASIALAAILVLAAGFNYASACDGAKEASASKSCPAMKASGEVKTASATSGGSCSAVKGTAEVKTAGATSGGSCSAVKGTAEVKTANANSSGCPYMKEASEVKTANTTSGGSCSGMKGMTEAKMANAMGGQCDYKGECANICLNIKGMTCTGCEKSVTEALKADKGVIKVISVDYKTGQAVVCYDPTKVESAKLAGLVTTAGYQAEVVPAVATSTGEKGMKKGASCDLTGKCTASTKSESKPISQ